MELKKICTAYHTDIGIKHSVNQDSLLVQGISNGTEEVLLAMICDGMGGMQEGEVASAELVRAFSEWFLNEYTKQGTDWAAGEIRVQWEELLLSLNRKLVDYGKKMNIKLGSTVTAVLLVSDGRYLIGHIGDTRVYQISSSMEQLTEDHTLVARKIKQGELTPEEALGHPQRNVLLQCIGVTENFRLQFLAGSIQPGEILVLCSDGFRHVVSEHELFRTLHGVWNQAELKKALVTLTELNKQRGEKDNISAVVLQLR